jgi:Beta-propeller repeat.
MTVDLAEGFGVTWRCLVGMGWLALAAVAMASERTTLGAEGRHVIAEYGSLPLLFARDVDRGDAIPRYYARGANYAVSISPQGAALVFGSHDSTRTTIELRLVGSAASARVAGLDPQPARIHQIGRNNGSGGVDIPTFARIAISDAYPGIDVIFHGQHREVEYDVIVAPGADPSRFAFRIEAGSPVTIDDAGEIDVGAARLKRPLAYQDVDGRRQIVASEYVIDSEHVVRIRVGGYDTSRALIIDPVVSYATFVGGSGVEQGTSIAVDAAGNAYITGYTMSTDFPLAGALDRSLGKRGDVDVFVSKLNPSGTALVWSTYIGGSTGVDRAVGIAVDASGSAYITGQTSGSDFPTSATAWQKADVAGGGFVVKLAPAGNALAYSTYVVGTTPSAIVVDANGVAHVTGRATSAFGTTANALQPVSANPGGTTGFLLALNGTGTAPLYATYLGGSSGEDVTSIALDSLGNTYVGGWTLSADFPTRGAFPSAAHGGKDAFVTKVAADGSRIVYSTRVGGSLDDAVNAIAVDAAGNAYIAGETYSTDFPVQDGFQMRKAGQLLVNSSVGNAFVAKLSPSGAAFVYSSFLGGEVCLSLCQLVFGPQPQFRADAAYGIAIDTEGHAYVTGIARSYTFPLVDSSSPRKQQDNEDSAFVAKIGISGGALLWSTFLRTGYGESDNAWTRFPPGSAAGVAVDASGAAYVTGDSDGGSVFAPTPGAFQTGTSGPAAVVVKFSPAATMSLTTTSATADTQTPVTLTATLSGLAVAGTVTFMDRATGIGVAPLVANRASITLTLPAGIHALSALVRVPGSASDTAVMQQVIDVPLVCN